MLDVAKDIHSLTEFKTRTPAFLRKLQASSRAVLLTVNGQAAVAVMSATTFQKVLEALDTLDSLRSIREGLDQMDQGKGRPAEEFFRKMRRKINLPDTA